MEEQMIKVGPYTIRKVTEKTVYICHDDADCATFSIDKLAEVIGDFFDANF